MINALHYCVSTSTNPYENLAAERYLTETLPEGSCILFLWQNEHTVVIGKNQNAWAECRCALLEEEGGKLARRTSGGGAVYHDIGNLNFSFICADADEDLRKQQTVLLHAVKLAGIDAELSGRNDLLADGRKFSGNAFFHARGRACHHGTLLISANTERMTRYLTPPAAKLAAKGVASVTARVVNLAALAPDLTCDKMKTYLLAAFEEVYGQNAEPMSEPDKQLLAPRTEELKSWDYLYGSSLPFTASAEARFDWGTASIKLNIADGYIQAIQMHTDAMDATLADKVCAAVSGKRTAPDEIRTALSEATDNRTAEDVFSLFLKLL